MFYLPAICWIFFIVVSAAVSAAEITSTISNHIKTKTVPELKGYYWQTWSNGYKAPADTNMGVAFSGWANVDQALSESSTVINDLPGTKMLSIGGGDSDGHLTIALLNFLNSAISAGSLTGYGGIVYDIEEADSGMASAFAASFALAKSNGFIVVVTSSHSAPYGVTDGADLMRSFLSDDNIDYISPQLYTTGTETANDFSTSQGVDWSEYASAKASIAPSIVTSSLYTDAQQQLLTYGVVTNGYIQWQQGTTSVTTKTLPELKGYYWQTWVSGYGAPSGTNAGIAFSGWGVVDSALAESAPIKSKLPGLKFFSIGGGNANGRFTTSRLTAVNNAITSGKLDGYDGIVYDIEEGDAGMSSHFASSFALAKSYGFLVVVTLAHSAPYGFTDGAALTRSFFTNTNIDYLSPQLYTTGTESTNDYAISKGVQWSEYAAAKASIAPSIVRASLYADAKQQFQAYGITVNGYIQWEQATASKSLSSVQGYYWQTWETGYGAPSDTNLAIAYSGWANVDVALSESSAVRDNLPGLKLVSIGGGTSNGRFDASILNSLNSAISSSSFARYDGIMYNIAQADAGMASQFATSFALAKSKGLIVLVTCSHSAPYGVSDGDSLMRSFFTDSNIDYISPQLYSTGTESKNDYATSKGVAWSEYATAKAAIIPSIINASFFEDAKNSFLNYGVVTFGYVQWQQAEASDSSSSSSDGVVLTGGYIAGIVLASLFVCMVCYGMRFVVKTTRTRKRPEKPQTNAPYAPVGLTAHSMDDEMYDIYGGGDEHLATSAEMAVFSKSKSMSQYPSSSRHTGDSRESRDEGIDITFENSVDASMLEEGRVLSPQGTFAINTTNHHAMNMNTGERKPPSPHRLMTPKHSNNNPAKSLGISADYDEDANVVTYDIYSSHDHSSGYSSPVKYDRSMSISDDKGYRQRQYTLESSNSYDLDSGHGKVQHMIKKFDKRPNNNSNQNNNQHKRSSVGGANQNAVTVKNRDNVHL
jgi:hypothetical protein